MNRKTEWQEIVRPKTQLDCGSHDSMRHPFALARSAESPRCREPISARFNDSCRKASVKQFVGLFVVYTCIYCILPLCDLSAAFCDIRFNLSKHWLPMIVEACGPSWRDWFKILLLDSKIKVQPPSGQNGVLPKSALITLLFEGPNLAGNQSRDVQCHAFCGEPSRNVFGKWWQVLPRCCCVKSRHCDLLICHAWSVWTN